MKHLSFVSLAVQQHHTDLCRGRPFCKREIFFKLETLRDLLGDLSKEFYHSLTKRFISVEVCLIMFSNSNKKAVLEDVVKTIIVAPVDYITATAVMSCVPHEVIHWNIFRSTSFCTQTSIGPRFKNTGIPH